MDEISKAIALAATSFAGKTDKAGKPYIFHLLRVMLAVPDELKPAAVLHDLWEDCEGVADIELHTGNFSETTIRLVDILTRRKTEEYAAYIQRLADYRNAITIKLSDLRDNMDIYRLSELTQKDLARLQKYKQAYNFLLIKQSAL